jgi:hypothetical protein
MSEPITLNTLVELAAELPPAEQRQLAESILQRLAAPAGPGRRSWREIRGSVPYPLCDEDAQDWVTRSRQESDDHREQPWRDAR